MFLKRANPLRTVFMGTPDFAIPALKMLIRSGHHLVCVFTQPPKPKGRGHRLSRSPVYELAEEHKIPIHTPASLKKEGDYYYRLAGMDIDVIVVAAYGLILPARILDIPKYGCLNIHASLLPRWRGASPIQQAILHGDRETGVCIMRMNEGLDTGDVVACRSVALDEHTTAPVLHDQLAMLGAEMIKDSLRQISVGHQLPASPQAKEGSTYAPILSRDSGKIEWENPAEQIDRQLRALHPWPGVWTGCNGRRIKILRAEVADGGNGQNPGTLLDRSGLVACGQGTALRILELQPPGKKPMDIPSAVNGGYLRSGDILTCPDD